MSHAVGLNEDFRDFLATLLEEQVEFVVVGAHALAAAGIVRGTKDLDVFVRASPENAPRVLAALRRFGAPLGRHGVALEDFARVGTIYQLGLPPRRIDLTTRIDGVAFDRAWAGRVEQRVDGLTLSFLGLEELVRNRRAVGRARDLADLELLREAGHPVDVRDEEG